MKQAKSSLRLRRIVQYMRPYAWRIGFGLTASLGVAAADGFTALLVKPGVDNLLFQHHPELIYLAPLAVLGISTLKGVSRYCQEFLMRTSAQMMVLDVRNQLFGHIVRNSLGHFSRRSVGELMSRVMNDVAMMQGSIAQTVVSMVSDGATMVALIAVAFYRDWLMALMVFTVMPLVGFTGARIGKRIKAYALKGQESVGQLTVVTEQAFSGIKVIKSFDVEEPVTERFRQQNRGLYAFIRKQIKYDSLTAPCMEVLTACGLAAVVWLGIQRTTAGQMSAGELLSLITAAGLIYSPVKKLARVNNQIQQALGAAERVFEALDEPLEIEDDAHAKPLVVSRGAVSFRHLTFGYGDEPVFRDFNLEIAPGERVALVGASGSGKTTLAALLSRFYEPQSGQILIDDQDIRLATLSSLRQQVAMVDQEAALFNETIAGNIRFGRLDADDEAVQWAATQAYADEFIRRLPDGYQTAIGDRGLRLSGGQRQRLCIARAILKDAPILILDEATSALDTESETMVQRALDNLMQGRTTLVIAHRLSTVVGADKIVVMDAGRILDSGTHQQLMERDGHYRRLYELQFQGT